MSRSVDKSRKYKTNSKSIPIKRQNKMRVPSKCVILKRGKGSNNAGGMSGGLFWHIYHQNERAGKIYINYDSCLEKPEIQIFLNQKNQGQGIGRIAYKRACEESNYANIYATMRKNNIASIKAALAAGFIRIPTESNQVHMLWSKINFDIEMFENLPMTLQKSNYIDLLIFIANLKPAVRIKTDGNNKCLIDWCINNQLYFSCGEDDYFYISRTKEIVERLKRTDASCVPHEYELGTLLGYPECCCKKISSVGEINIDKWEEAFINNSVFRGEYELINPKGYRDGYALLSHVPCSSTCRNSLEIALEVLCVVVRNKNNQYFSNLSNYMYP